MIFTTDILEPRRARLTRWIGAAVFVVAAHVGCTALALFNWHDNDAEDSAASPVIVEMIPAPTATPVDALDLAHGPLMDDQAPTREAAKETKPEVEEEMPKVEPSPAPDPEVVLPMLKPVLEKKPEEKKPEEEKAKDEEPKPESAEQVAAAPPRVEATEAPVAPSPGSAAAAARAKATWEKSLVSHLNRFKRYPDTARSRGNQGAVSVEFVVDRTGGVVASRVVHSSGSSALDEEALAVLQRASPLPAPPELVAGATFNLTLPIQFRIR